MLLALLVTHETVAAPTTRSSVITPPYGPLRISSVTKPKSVAKAEGSGRHTTRAERHVESGVLQAYLESKRSPLAPYSRLILESSHWSTIIGICAIEQYGCTKAPSWNYWGIMCSGRVCHYGSAEEGIAAISNLLAKYEARGKDTIESMNGYYVVPASSLWLNTVIKTKAAVEGL